MLFRKNKRNQPSEDDIQAIEQRVRAARDQIMARRPGIPSPGAPPSASQPCGILQPPPRQSRPGGPVMPSEIPDFLSSAAPDALSRPQGVAPAGAQRVLPGDIPAFLQNPAAHAASGPDHARPERVLPSDIASEEADPAAEQASFTFPSATTTWKHP